jgi:hypothetical protein
MKIVIWGEYCNKVEGFGHHGLEGIPSCGSGINMSCMRGNQTDYIPLDFGEDSVV